MHSCPRYGHFVAWIPELVRSLWTSSDAPAQLYAGATMSNSQWNPNHERPPQGPSPWQQQDPSWTGPQFHDQQGRDPRQPFGQQRAPHQQAPSIDDYAHDPAQERRNKRQLLIIGAVMAVIAAIFISLQFLGGNDTAGPDPDSTEGPQISYDPSAAATNSSVVPFEGNGTGTFEVLDYSWDGDLLTVKYRITLEEGRQNFSVFVFSNETKMQHDALEDTASDVTSDSPYEGTATFQLEQGDATLVLGTGAGRALTALPLPA